MSTIKRSSTSPPHPRPVAFPTLLETWCHQSIHGTTIFYLNDGACTLPLQSLLLWCIQDQQPTLQNCQWPPSTASFWPQTTQAHTLVLQGAPPIQPDAHSAATHNFVSIAPNLPYSNETHSIPPHVTTRINTNLVDVPFPPDALSIFRASSIYSAPVFILPTTPTPP